MRRNALRSGGPLQKYQSPPEIDLPTLEKLAAIGCTDAEIAAFFEIPLEHFRYRKRDEKVAGVMKRGKAKARVELRLKFFDRRIVSAGLSFRKGSQ